MKIRSLSYSAVSLLEQCPAKFWLTYTNPDGRPISENTFEGSLTHDVLEKWMPDRTQDFKAIAKEIFAGKKNEKTGKLEYECMNGEQYISTLELLEAFSQRKDLDVKTLEYEKKFDVVLPNGVPINGRIDRIDEIGNTLNFVDYKTARAYIWKSEIEQSLQGMMYALAARILYPGKKITFTIDPLRFSPITVFFNDHQLDAAMKYLEVRWDQIQQIQDIPEYRINRFCGYCQFRNECPAVANATRNIFGELIDTELKTVCESVLLLEEHIKSLTKLQDGYTRTLDQHMQAQKKKSLNFGDSYCFYKENASGSKVKCVSTKDKIQEALKIEDNKQKIEDKSNIKIEGSK